MTTLDLDKGLRQPIADLIAQGHSAPWAVFCNSLCGYSSGTHESELGEVNIRKFIGHTPVDDLLVMPMATWTAIQQEPGEYAGEWWVR